MDHESDPARTPGDGWVGEGGASHLGPATHTGGARPDNEHGGDRESEEQNADRGAEDGAAESGGEAN